MNSPAKTGQSRLILCDPVCVFPYGHNVAAMDNFRTFLGPYFDSVICIGCRELPNDIATARQIEQTYTYYYNDAMPLPGSDARDDIPVRHADKIKAARADLIALLARHKVTKHDVLCFPSVDFYALQALADCIEALVAAGRPTVMLRLIGVMETAASGAYAKPMKVVLALIARLHNAGIPLKLAAETPRYADFLAMQLDCPVAVTANIETREQLPLPDSDRFTVICPGSARYDKGFLNLLEIFTNVRRRDPHLKIRFQTQVLPDRDLKHQLNYLTRLYAVPGVTVLPSQVSSRQIEEMYDGADLVLLPYAADVYEFRGSAVLIEAMCAGRHVLALDGPAFVDQMRFFGSGTVCASLSEMADRVIEYSRHSPRLRFAQARQARERFTRDLSASYRDWVI